MNVSSTKTEIPQQTTASADENPVSTASANDMNAEFSEAVAQARGSKIEADPVAATTDEPVKAESKPEGKSDLGDTTAPKKDDNSHKQNRGDRRWGELTKKLHEREARIAYLEQRLEQKPKAKDRAEYDDDIEFVKDLAEDVANEKVIREQIESLKASQVKEQRERWQEQIRETFDNPAEFIDRVTRAVQSGMIDAFTEKSVLASPMGVKMLDVILKKFETAPGFAEMWREMPDTEKAIALHDLKSRVQLQKRDVSAIEPAKQQVNQQVIPSLAPARGDRAPVTPNNQEAEYQQYLKEIRSRRL